MSTQTTNFNFDLREGTDIFNPLSTNTNWESLDNILKDMQEKGGIITYTTTASANLLKLSGTPVANDTVFKFVAAGDANTWTGASGGVVNKIVGLDGVQKKINSGNLYVAWVNAANSMVVIAWPDVVNAQTFDGKGPTEWATKAQLDSVNQTAANATQTAQAAATVANQANSKAEEALSKAGGLTFTTLYTHGISSQETETVTVSALSGFKFLIVTCVARVTDNPNTTDNIVIPSPINVYRRHIMSVFGTNNIYATRGISFPTATSIKIDSGDNDDESCIITSIIGVK